MVIGKITSYLALGLVGAFLLNTLIRPGSALATGSALQETGSGVKAIGEGIESLLSALGTGGADLFKPLWELKNLIYSSNVPGAASVGPSAQVEGETNYGILKPSSSTITWSSGTTASVPSLSPAAKSYYRGLGVSVN
tara:strand:+ start:217 stop:630 length:414 start_codon:yes stop_codon:yes gene_type:complete